MDPRGGDSVMDGDMTEPHQHPLTVDDLRRMPDDSGRCELVDGRLDVTPVPVLDHTRIEGRLLLHLALPAPDRLEVLRGPGVNVNADATHHRAPDIAVINQHDITHPYLTKPPLLAVEITSPETIFRDHHTKRVEYAEFGIESYWIISPSTDKPGIVELRLEDGVYQVGSQAFGDEVFEAEFPFPIKLVPRWLIESGPWKKHIGGE